jgi:arylsulfatase A-like enzyme
MRILYVDIDTLRADHTGPYGYQRRLTPNLDELTKSSVVFERVYASDSPCAPSRAAWSSGQFGITSGAIGNFGPAADIHFFERGRFGPLLGGHLYRNGIYTASISCFPERHMAYWFIGNFREWMKPSLSNGDDEDAKDVTAAALGWLDRHGREESWFLQVHYWDPHLPYLELREFYRRAELAGDPPDWPDQQTIKNHARVYGPHSALDLYEGDGSWAVPPPPAPNPELMPDAIRTRDDFVSFVTGYDGAVAYVDHHLGMLLEKLAQLGIAEETAIIFTSDHGECLGEHGIYGDHPLASESSHHVPLVIRWPGLTEKLPESARRVSAFLYGLDLGPTLCELLGIEIPEGWEGVSFAKALAGQPIESRPWLVLSHGSYSYQRALITEGELFISTLHPGCFRLEQHQLYDTSRDPHLTENLALVKPERAAELYSLIESFRQEHLTMRGPNPDPMEAARYEGPADAFYVPAYLKRLRSTGREDLADDLKARLSAPWVSAKRWPASFGSSLSGTVSEGRGK